MLQRLMKFYRDDRGCVPATEWMLVASILTLGTLAALWSIQHSDERAEDAPPALMYSAFIHE